MRFRREAFVPAHFVMYVLHVLPARRPLLTTSESAPLPPASTSFIFRQPIALAGDSGTFLSICTYM